MEFQQVFEWGMKRNVPDLLAPLDSAGPILNLGAGNTLLAWSGFEWSKRVVDLDLPGWNADSPGRFDNVPPESIDGIFAFHLMEHVDDPIDLLWDCQTILRVGAPMTIVVPYYSAQIAAQDLTHKHQFCETTWDILMSNPHYDGPHVNEWRFEVGFNVICGIAERNLVLMSQLIKT